MGRKINVKDSLKDAQVTKINGQWNDEDMTKLLSKLLAIAASIPTTNRGGFHGHVEMLLDNAECRTVSTGGTSFTIPTNLGLYPITVDPPNVAVRARQVAC